MFLTSDIKGAVLSADEMDSNFIAFYGLLAQYYASWDMSVNFVDLLKVKNPKELSFGYNLTGTKHTGLVVDFFKVPRDAVYILVSANFYGGLLLDLDTLSVANIDVYAGDQVIPDGNWHLVTIQQGYTSNSIEISMSPLGGG